MPARPCRLGHWVVALVIVLVGIGASPLPAASAADGGSISGTVTEDGSGDALGGVYVEARRLVAGEWAFAGSSVTAPDGTYHLDGLNADSYRLVFAPDDGEHVFEWFDDKPTVEQADAITVGTGAAVTGKDAALVVGGRIEGNVTDGSDVLPDVTIVLYQLGATGDWTHVDSASTDNQGHYKLGRVRPGSYRLQFDGTGVGHQAEFWDNDAAIESADDIAVASDSTVNRDADLGALPPGPPTVISGNVTITGTPRVGSVLTAHAGAWTPFDLTLAYQWLADEVPIPQATSTAFAPTASEVGKVIKVRVTGSKSGYTSSSAASAGTSPVVAAQQPPVVNTAPPTLSGAARVGSLLTASPGTWTPAGVSFAYKWLSDGAPLAGATGPTYTVPATQVGRAISVRVTGAKPDHTPASADSAGTAGIGLGRILNTVKPKLKGKAKVLTSLTLKPGTFAPAGAQLTIRWLVHGKQVKGAKGKTFALKMKHLGKVVTARVSASMPGYAPLVVTTAGRLVAASAKG